VGFWAPRGQNDPLPGVETPDDLRSLRTANTAKVALDVRVTREAGGALVTTETGAVATDSPVAPTI